MINVHRKATMPILSTYNLSVYCNDDTQVVYVPIYNLLNAGVPKSVFEDKEYKGFGKPKVKQIITVNYFGKQIDCVTVEKFLELLTHSETPLGKAVVSEMTLKGIKHSTKHLQNGELGKIKLGEREIKVQKDSKGVPYLDISALGATEKDLIELRKDGEFWHNEILKLEYIDLPKEPEFGWHPLTESIKHPDNEDELLNMYGAASIACFGLFESNSKEAKKLLKQALSHASREDEYYYFLYCIKSGVDKGEVTMAQSLMAEYLQYQFEQQIK